MTTWKSGKIVTLAPRQCGYRACRAWFQQPPAPRRYRKHYCCRKHRRLAAQARAKAKRLNQDYPPLAELKPRPVQHCAVCGDPRTPSPHGGRMPVYCKEACAKKAARERARKRIALAQSFRSSR